MAEHDPLDRELRALAAEAEQHIGDPMDASRVRRLGAQRRRRRFTAIVATSVAALALSGGVVFSSIIDQTQEQPSPAQPPGVTVAPTPTVSPTPDALADPDGHAHEDREAGELAGADRRPAHDEHATAEPGPAPYGQPGESAAAVRHPHRHG